MSKYSINRFKPRILGSHFIPPVIFALSADLSFVKIPRQTSLVVVTVRSIESSSFGLLFEISTIPFRICAIEFISICHFELGLLESDISMIITSYDIHLSFTYL